jgi:hypothetical protein
MSYTLYTSLKDHREPLVAQLVKQISKDIPEFGKLSKARLKEDCGYLFDGVIDLVCTEDTAGLDTYFSYLVRRSQQDFKLSGCVHAILVVPTILRQFLQAAYREQIIGGGRSGFEDSIDLVETGTQQAVIRFAEAYEQHVRRQVSDHNEAGKGEMGEAFNRLILFRG